MSLSDFTQIISFLKSHTDSICLFEILNNNSYNHNFVTGFYFVPFNGFSKICILKDLFIFLKQTNNFDDLHCSLSISSYNFLGNTKTLKKYLHSVFN